MERLLDFILWCTSSPIRFQRICFSALVIILLLLCISIVFILIGTPEFIFNTVTDGKGK